MVQVDVSWAFGVGASFALVAKTHLVERDRLAGGRYSDGFLSWPYLQALAFAAFIIGPFTGQLLTAYPEWQLMYVIDGRPDPWLVAGILALMPAAVTIGFALGWAAVRAGAAYVCYLLFLAGYFGLFFGMMYGWDGTGYQRLFSTSREAFEAWSWDNAAAWNASDIAATFNLHMAVIVPYLLFFASFWIRRAAPTLTPQIFIIGKLVVLVFVGIPLSALAATLLVESFGPKTGGGAAGALMLVLVLPRVGPFWWCYRWVFGTPAGAPS